MSSQESTDRFQKICTVEDVPPGEGRSFEVGEEVIAVFNDNGTFRAIHDMCPHMGASLSAGHLEDSVVSCPWHAWRFDTRDGTWCDNRRVSIHAYELRVVGNEILIDPTPRPKPDFREEQDS